MAKHTKQARKPSGSPARRRPLPAWMNDTTALFGLLILVLVFFWPVLTGQAFLWEDFPEQIYPFRAYTAAELHAGRFPLWNPYLFGGIPFFAMIDTAVLYPLNWLFILLAGNGTLSFLAVEWHTIAHVLLLGVGTYYFCRSVGISRTGAFAAGGTFMLSGVIVHHVFHASLLNPIAWLPLIFLLLIQTLDRLSIPWAVATGAMVGVSIIAGHPQVFLYIACSMGLYYLICLISRLQTAFMPSVSLLPSSERESRSKVGWDALRMTGIFAITMAVGLGLAAVVFLPAYELVGFSLRRAVPYETVVSYSLAPRQLITLLMPDFFGKTDPVAWDYWGPGRNEYGHFWETYTYIGILPLLLAGVAVVMRRDRLPRFFGLLALLTLLLSLGGATPVYRLLYAVVPGFDKFRSPARIGLIFGFAIAALVGFGLDTIRTMRDRAPEQARLRWYLLITGGITLVGILASLVAGDEITGWLAGSAELRQKAEAAMAAHGGRFVLLSVLSFGLLAAWQKFRRWGGLLTAIAIGLILFDLFTAGYDFNLGRSGPEEFYPYNELVQFLQQRQREEGGRASLRAGPYMLMKRNAGMLFHIFTLEGYTSPLRLERTLPPVDEGRALDLMNVKYRIQVDQKARTAGLAINPSYLPRAFVVRNYVVAHDIDAAAREMGESTFNYRAMVTLDERPSPDIPMVADSIAAPERPAITRYDPNQITMTVEMTRAGLLVVSEVYYPAWQAYIDGRPHRIYRADGTLRAVPLTAGRHTVEFRYESTSLRIGGLISALSLLVVAATAVVLWRRTVKGT